MVFILLSLLFFFPTQVSANTSAEGFIVDPIFRELDLSDQNSVETNISITNETDQPQEVVIYARDITQEPITGKLLFIDGYQGQYPHSLAPYIRFDKDRFVVPAGQTEQLQVTVENRDSLNPGGHYTAIIVEAQIAEFSEKTAIFPGLASVLFVRKLGGIQIAYTLEKISGLSKINLQLPNQIETTFYNDGNTHSILRGFFKVTGWNERLLAQTVFNPDSSVIFPSTKRSMNTNVRFQEMPWLLEPITLEFTYRDTSETEFKTITLSGLYVHPVLLISILIGIVTATILVRKMLKQFKA